MRGGNRPDGTADEEVDEEFRRFGVDEAELAKMREAEAEADEDFELWPENLPAFDLFTAAMTQMRINDFTGLPIGLDYAGLRACAGLRRVKLTPALFGDVQVMERAYIDERRKRAERERT